MGPSGAGNMTMNLTANMTAGPPGANGANGADGAAATIAVGTVITGFPSSVTNVGTAAAAIFNFVLEQGIQGPAGPPGAPGTAADVNDYYLNDTSKPLYGYHLFRNVNNDFLQLMGGGSLIGQGGSVKVFGKDYAPTYGGGILFEVPDAAMTNMLGAAYFEGDTDTPRLNMMGNNITQILKVVAPSDATNKSYVDTAIAGVSGGSTNLSAVYPIGSVYISTLSTDPKITFEGFGCWTSVGTGYVITGV